MLLGHHESSSLPIGDHFLPLLFCSLADYDESNIHLDPNKPVGRQETSGIRICISRSWRCSRVRLKSICAFAKTARD